MEKLGYSIFSILTAIIAVALLAVMLSKKADTANVIGSVGTAFSEMLRAALAPIN